MIRAHFEGRLDGKKADDIADYMNWNDVSTWHDSRGPTLWNSLPLPCVTHHLEVLRGSSGLNALLIMEGKISGVKARGRPRRASTDDLKD